MLRVIAGKYRGSKLYQPPKSITRPTMDRVKEAMFNMIQFKIQDAIVLDIFTGSGSLSIEAISRGAMKSIAVDCSKDAIAVINKNIQKLNIQNIEVIKGDVLYYVSLASGKKFDFIFMDPPFKEYDLYNQVLQEIVKSKILKTMGLIVLETDRPQNLIIPEALTIQKQKKHGISTILILANNI